jgi:hypothetical protein
MVLKNYIISASLQELEARERSGFTTARWGADPKQAEENSKGERVERKILWRRGCRRPQAASRCWRASIVWWGWQICCMGCAEVPRRRGNDVPARSNLFWRVQIWCGEVEPCLYNVESCLYEVEPCPGEVKSCVHDVESCLYDVKSCPGEVESWRSKVESCLCTVEPCLHEVESCVREVKSN